MGTYELDQQEEITCDQNNQIQWLAMFGYQ